MRSVLREFCAINRSISANGVATPLVPVSSKIKAHAKDNAVLKALAGVDIQTHWTVVLSGMEEVGGDGGCRTTVQAKRPLEFSLEHMHHADDGGS